MAAEAGLLVRAPPFSVISASLLVSSAAFLHCLFLFYALCFLSPPSFALIPFLKFMTLIYNRCWKSLMIHQHQRFHTQEKIHQNFSNSSRSHFLWLCLSFWLLKTFTSQNLSWNLWVISNSSALFYYIKTSGIQLQQNG